MSGFPEDATFLCSRKLSSAQRRRCPGICVFKAGRCELLQQLCFPLSPRAFFHRCWQQRALAVHGSPARMKAMSRELLYNLSLPKLLQHTSSDEFHVWLTATSSGALESFKTPDVEAALACHRAGGSLYFRAPPEASELLTTALTQQLGLSFGAFHADMSPRSEVETFVSRKGHVTRSHFDFMQNFTLQLQGVKQWKLKPSTVEVPIRGCTPQWGRTSARVRSAAEQQAKCHTQHSSVPFEMDLPDDFWDDAAEVELRPGSVLYVPAGMWHEVECTEDSISINISIMGASWADLVADAVRQRLLTHSVMRAPICFRSAAEGRKRLRSMLELLSTEAQALQPSDLLPSALAFPRVERVALPPHQVEARIERATKFQRNSLAVLIRLPQTDQSEEESEEGSVEGSEPDAASDEEGESDEHTLMDTGARVPRRTRCGGGERLVSTASLFVGGTKGEPDCTRYVLTSHFGNEELASLLRVQERQYTLSRCLEGWGVAVQPILGVAAVWQG